jgi:hypothetical protein
MVTSSVWIRLNLSHRRPGKREERCPVRNLADLLVDILLGCVIYFWGQAGSAIAEPA